MRKRVVFLFAAFLLLSLSAIAQDAQQAASQPKPAGTTAETNSAKTASISGLVGANGKSLLAEVENKVWKVLNPECLQRIEGERVVVRARLVAASDAIFITSVKVAAYQQIAIKFDDSAFRR